MTPQAPVVGPFERAALQNTFCELVTIDNPSYDERAMADAVIARLQGIGLAVTEDGAAARIGGNAGNLYARLPGAGALADAEPIAFCAHLDSVSPAVGKRAVVCEDGRVRSAGNSVLGADDLSAVASILETVRLLHGKSPSHRPVELLFTVCEEPYTKGSRALDFAELPLRAKKIFVPDLAGRVGTAALAAPTILSVTVTVTGRASHAGFAPEQGIHAIAVAARALSRLTLGHVDADTTVGMGTIRGGTVPNAVPACCEIGGEIRGYSDDGVREEYDKVCRIFEEEARAAGATVQITHEKLAQAYRVGEDAAIVRMFLAACEQAAVPAQLIRTFGGSDANTFAARGLETLVIANAMENVHSVREETDMTEMMRLCRILWALATADLTENHKE